MIMAMIRPETEMKDSGVQWIGDIPSDWNIKPLYACLDEINQKNNPVLTTNILSLTNTDGVIPYSERGNQGNKSKENFEEYKVVYPNTIVANSMNILIGSVGLSKYEGCVSPVYYVYMAKPQVDIRYMNYLFQMEPFQKRLRQFANGILEIRLRVSSHDILHQKVAVPDYDEQQTIADYLDKTCSKIDEIIAEAKASIDEYEKLKQATIDENILGYDSVHIKLRQLGSLKNGLNFSHSDDVANIKFLGVGCFKDNMILSDVDDFADEHIDFEISEEYLLSNGDIVFVRSNGSKELVGRSIMVENIDYPVTFSGFCIRFRNMHTELVDNRFLLYYFRTTHFKQSLLKYSNDSTNINNLNQEMLNAIRINTPVIAEQKLLVKKMEKQVFVFDSLISEKESLINDLEAYKKSLIYEVVTGKRRVV